MEDPSSIRQNPGPEQVAEKKNNYGFNPPIFKYDAPNLRSKWNQEDYDYYVRHGRVAAMWGAEELSIKIGWGVRVHTHPDWLALLYGRPVISYHPGDLDLTSDAYDALFLQLYTDYEQGRLKPPADWYRRFPDLLTHFRIEPDAIARHYSMEG